MKEKLKELQIKEIYTKGIKMNNMKVKKFICSYKYGDSLKGENVF